MRAFGCSRTIYNSHTHKRARRSIIAGILAAIYLLIALSPLASFAIYSKSMAHALTNECSGDCNICGCSAESRANRTCCCARKIQQQENFGTRTAKQCLTPQNFNVTAEVKNRGCCAASPPVKPVVAQKGCCLKVSRNANDEQAHERKAESTKHETVYKCGCPCDKGKILALAGTGTSEALPYIYSERIILSYEDTRYFHPPHQLSTRHTEPPDPPPKIFPV